MQKTLREKTCETQNATLLIDINAVMPARVQGQSEWVKQSMRATKISLE